MNVTRIAARCGHCSGVFWLGETEEMRGHALALVHCALQEMVEALTGLDIPKEQHDLILQSARVVKTAKESGTPPSEDFMRNGAEVMNYLHETLTPEPILKEKHS